MNLSDKLWADIEKFWLDTGETPESISAMLAKQKICFEIDEFNTLRIYKYRGYGCCHDLDERLSELTWYGLYKRGYPVACRWEVDHKAEKAKDALLQLNQQLANLYDSYVFIVPGSSFFSELLKLFDHLKTSIKRIDYAFYRDNPEYQMPEYLELEEFD